MRSHAVWARWLWTARRLQKAHARLDHTRRDEHLTITLRSKHSSSAQEQNAHSWKHTFSLTAVAAHKLVHLLFEDWLQASILDVTSLPAGSDLSSKVKSSRACAKLYTVRSKPRSSCQPGGVTITSCSPSGLDTWSLSFAALQGMLQSP